MSKRVGNTIYSLWLSIIFTAGILFSAQALAFGPSCGSLFANKSVEYFRKEVLGQFLVEDPGLDLVKRYILAGKTEKAVENPTRFYTSVFGHLEINSGVWDKNYLSPYVKTIGRLEFDLAEGAHQRNITYAGASFSNADFSNIRKGEKYAPGYFFSTTRSHEIADGFLNREGAHHSGETHVKLFFEVTGQSGKDIAGSSDFDEAEVLYPPDTQFQVVNVLTGRLDEKGFRHYKVILSENIKPPPHRSIVKYSNKDLLRMQPRDAYESEKRSGNDNTLSIYAPKSIEAYKRAILFVNSAVNKREMSVALLKEIHQIALEGSYFEGYYRRRVRRDYINGKIGFDQALSKLQRIEEQSDLMNEKLPGTFRSESVDNFVMTGLNLDTKGLRYFTRSELYAISKNPYLKIETDTVRSIENDKNKLAAKVLFLPTELIEREVEVLIQKADLQLKNATSDYEYVMAVLKLQQGLISIHPFHDGNGRAIKLLSDFLYLQRGLAPPLHPIDTDYTLSLVELYRRTIDEMYAYTQRM